MLNRWWSVSETCGELDTSLSFGVEDVEQCCATSRHIIIGATSPQAAPLWACQRLSMVKHLRRLLYFPFLRHLRRLREEEEYLAEIAEPAEEIINLNNQINLCETQTHHLRGNAHTEQTH